MVGAGPVAVVEQRVAVVQVEVAFRAPREAVEADVIIEGHAPQDALRLQSRAFHAAVLHEVECVRSENVEVVAAVFEADDDRVWREREQVPARLEAALAVRFEEEDLLASADEEVPGAVELHGHVRVVRRAVDERDFQLRIGDGEVRALRRLNGHRYVRRLRLREVLELGRILGNFVLSREGPQSERIVRE